MDFLRDLTRKIDYFNWLYDKFTYFLEKNVYLKLPSSIITGLLMTC